MNIGQLIKTERQKQNIKQDALAEGICSPSHLSKIENGQTLPSERIQQRLLTRLNLSITESNHNLSSEEFNRFADRFIKVINHRDKIDAELLCSDIKDFLNKHPLYNNKLSLLLMENRLLLFTEENLDLIKKNISVFISIKDELTNKQRFHLNIIEGIIAYRENRFNNALHIFTMTYNMTQIHKFSDWEIAELNYILSLAAISDYRYIIAINHVQDALLYYNAIVQPKRSIECLIVLGIAQKHTENVDAAISTFKKANEIMINTNTLQYQGIIEQNLGACYSLLKDSVQSLRHFKQSIAVKNQPEEKFITILSIIKEYKKIGKTNIAKKWLNKGIALLTDLKQYEDSPYFYHFSIHKALLYDSPNLISTFEATLKYFESKQNYYQCFIYCHVLAKQIAENNQFKLATTYYQKAFDFHLKYRKVSLWDELT